jgi:predicted TIM-barrel fold metal-dependent hydrolase
LVIDCHQHIGSGAAIMGSAADAEEPDEERDREAACRELGISHAIIQPAFEYRTTQGDLSVRALNDNIAAYVERHEWVVAGLGVVDPLAMTDPVGEAERIVGTLGLSGLAWHNRFQRLPTNSPDVLRVIDACPRETRVIAMHSIGESRIEAPWRLGVVATMFPHHRFLAMSSLTAHSQCDEMIQLCRRCPNLYLETANLSPVGLWIERIVASIGAERLLLGTSFYLDPPVFRHNYALQAVEAAHITDNDRERILARNAVELFGIDL